MLLNLLSTPPVGGGPAPPFNPATLFANGELGGIWDFNDISTLFQDIAGTIPVTAAGQPVGRVTDKGPNGDHWIAFADDGARPTYRVDTGFGYLQFDGSNDSLYANPFVATAVLPGVGGMAFAVIMGIHSLTGAGAVAGGTGRGVLCQAALTGTGTQLEIGSSTVTATTARMIARPDSGGTPVENGMTVNTFDGTKTVFTCRYAGSTLNVNNRNATSRPVGGGNGNYNTSALNLTGLTFSFARCAIGTRAFFTAGAPNRINLYSGRVYSGVRISRDLTESEIRNTENWCAARMAGVVLP